MQHNSRNIELYIKELVFSSHCGGGFTSFKAVTILQVAFPKFADKKTGAYKLYVIHLKLHKKLKFKL